MSIRPPRCTPCGAVAAGQVVAPLVVHRVVRPAGRRQGAGRCYRGATAAGGQVRGCPNVTGVRGCRPPRLQAFVIEALVAAHSIEKAAARTNVSERTIRRWLADPAFHAALVDAQHRVFADATAALSAGSIEAVT